MEGRHGGLPLRALSLLQLVGATTEGCPLSVI